MRRHLRIEGLVQGVGFRWSTREEGRRLKVVGWVRNTHDGAVEAVVDGDETAVGTFIRWCHQGPRGAQVTYVQVREVADDEMFGDFSIRH